MIVDECGVDDDNNKMH